MDDATDRVKHSYVELSRAFVEEVGEARAREFGAALQRAHGRLAGGDHERARVLVEEEAGAVGVRLAPPEASAFADQLARFDRFEVFLPGDLPPVQPGTPDDDGLRRDDRR